VDVTLSLVWSSAGTNPVQLDPQRSEGLLGVGGE